jgi:methionine synthase I (cobalamin-dependent)
LAGGVDGFIIETMTALDEVIIAVEAIKSFATDKPVLVSMSFDEAKLMLDAGRINAHVNRLYYACFYAVSALLLTRDFSTSKANLNLSSCA